jgi:hypothetical protein
MFSEAFPIDVLPKGPVVFLLPPIGSSKTSDLRRTPALRGSGRRPQSKDRAPGIPELRRVRALQLG